MLEVSVEAPGFFEDQVRRMSSDLVQVRGNGSEGQNQ